MVDIKFMFSWECSALPETRDSVFGYHHYNWSLLDCQHDVKIPLDDEIGIFLDRIIINALKLSKSEEEFVDKTVDLLNSTVLHELIHLILVWDETGVNWAVEAMLYEGK